eukprot:2577589-Alexandrium_andersonii.AAC.1
MRALEGMEALTPADMPAHGLGKPCPLPPLPLPHSAIPRASTPNIFSPVHGRRLSVHERLKTHS